MSAHPYNGAADPIDGLQRTLQRQSLRYSAGKAFIDARRAVEVTVTLDPLEGDTQRRIALVKALPADAWDANGDAFRAAVLERYPDASFEVLDGRDLFGRK